MTTTSAIAFSSLLNSTPSMSVVRNEQVLNGNAKNWNGVAAGKGNLVVPQGLTREQFSSASSIIRQKIGSTSDDIVVQGSRANGTARPDSDIDFAVRVSPEKFNELISQRFGRPNPSSAKERTMQHAIETGKIQSGEAGLRGYFKNYKKS